MSEDFDPNQYMSKIGGADYLEVKFRLLWLRRKHPDATVDTELLHYTPAGSEKGTGLAVVRAVVSIPGGGSASGLGSETPGDFRDFLEKAETKSIGRALAALGFGTQFSTDHDFGAAQGRVVDSPVKPRNGDRRSQENSVPTTQSRNVHPTPATVSTPPVAAQAQGLGTEDRPSAAMLSDFWAMVKEAGLLVPEVQQWSRDSYRCEVPFLSMSQFVEFTASVIKGQSVAPVQSTQAFENVPFS